MCVIKFTYSLLSHNLEGIWKVKHETKPKEVVLCDAILFLFSLRTTLACPYLRLIPSNVRNPIWTVYSSFLVGALLFKRSSLDLQHCLRATGNRIFALCFYRPTESESSVNKVPSLIMISIHIKISEVLP